VSIARIMIMVETAPPSAVADQQVKADEWSCFSWYMVGVLYAVWNQNKIWMTKMRLKLTGKCPNAHFP
jgi:hypothetical protein